MTSFVLTVCMIVTRLTTLMAYTYDLIGDALTQSFVKNKILANEFIFFSLFFYLPGFLNDSSIQLENIFKSTMLHPGACLFTTNAAGAIHDDILFLFVFQHFFNNRK